MTPPLPPWSLHWSSNGELSPLDREDLFLQLHLQGSHIAPRPPGTPGPERPGSVYSKFPTAKLWH